MIIWIFAYFTSCIFSNKLLWISVDGFRASYLETKYVSFLKNKCKDEFCPKLHVPNFISKTFPNHFSAATGLSEEEHQIVDNFMYDKKLGKFNMENTDIAWWDPKNSTLPIWTASKLAGLKTATISWPGSNVKFKGILPDFYEPIYNHTCGISCRISKAVDILSQDYQFTMLYIAEIDEYGHKYGVGSTELNSMLRKVDLLLENFFKTLAKKNLLHNLNVMITSDHGMANVDPKKIIYLEDKFSKDFLGHINMISTYNVATIFCKLADRAMLISAYKNVQGVQFAGLKQDLPESFHYNKSTRIPPVIIIMKEGWNIRKYRGHFLLKGNHGYPAEWAPSMNALFIGFGPYFKDLKPVLKTSSKDLFFYGVKALNLTNFIDEYNQQNKNNL